MINNEIIFNALSTFLSHPLVIALIIYFLGRYTLYHIIPNKKEKTIEKFVELKNLLGEAELCNKRINITTNFAAKEGIFLENSDLESDISRMSIIINEKLPLQWCALANDIEIYFDDKKLLEAARSYYDEFNKFHKFVVISLVKDPIDFLVKNKDFGQLPFQKLKIYEDEMLKALKKAKSIKLSNR